MIPDAQIDSHLRKRWKKWIKNETDMNSALKFAKEIRPKIPRIAIKSHESILENHTHVSESMFQKQRLNLIKQLEIIYQIKDTTFIVNSLLIFFASLTLEYYIIFSEKYGCTQLVQI